MNNCRLNGLNVDVLHYLFDYFSAHEIFYTFYNITPYIDAVMITYSNYRINLNRINRNYLELICPYIMPAQVVSLTLSNNEVIPDLVDFFLSRFQIYQFINLQVLKMMHIESKFWESIVADIDRLKYLKSFSFICSNGSVQWILDMSEDRFMELNQSLFNIYAPILLHLHELKLNHSTILNSVQFSCFRPLTFKQMTVNLIKDISVMTPQFETIDNNNFLSNGLSIKQISSTPRLTRLILKIKDLCLSMNVLEQMIPNFLHLKHLEIISNCDEDVVDGERWQIKVKNLVTFKFIFYLSSELKSEKLDSFQTPFWLNEKQWYVAYTSRCFFSVPHFTTIKSDDYVLFPRYTTKPDYGFFYRNYEQLKPMKTFKDRNGDYPKIRTLVLESHPDLSHIKEVIDLDQIGSLTLCSLPDRFPIRSLINAMPNLCQISIEFNADVFLEKFHAKTLSKIRTLIIHYIFISDTDLTISRLSNTFPSIEHLHIDSVCLINEIVDCLHWFKCLSTASFRYLRRRATNVDQYCLQVRSHLNKLRNANEINYIYRFDHSIVYFTIITPWRSRFPVNRWINQPETNSILKTNT